MRVAIALAAWLGCVTLGHALPILDADDLAPERRTSATSRDVFAETELYCLALALFFEGGSTGEPEVGLRHIATVVTERAKANRSIWGGSTICGVVFYKRKICQFSFACLPLARRTPKMGPLWQQSYAIARETLTGETSGADPSIRYYMNEKLSALKFACLFRKEFVLVAAAGRHEFFREATPAEREELAKGNPEACQRYAASLQSKKKKTAKAGKQDKAKKLALAAKKKKKRPTRTAAR